VRLLIEVLVLGALIYLCWEKPFRDYTPWTKPRAAHGPTTSAPSGAWMWDPNRKTPLDRPSYNQNDKPQGKP
jgi:hypothetical protein